MAVRGLTLASLFLAATPPADSAEPVLPAAEIVRRLQAGADDGASGAPAELLPAAEIAAKLVRMRGAGVSPTMVLPGMAFVAGSAQLTPAAERQLDEVAMALGQPMLADLPVTVTSHTDNSGSDAYNLRLSRQRAAIVRHHLVARNGLSPGSIVAIGMGERQLMPGVPPNAAGQRRIELTLMR